MKKVVAIALAAAAFGFSAGCVKNVYPRPNGVPAEAPIGMASDWTAEKQRRLDETMAELERLRTNRPPPLPPNVTLEQVNAYEAENARRKEKINFLIGEINALLVERGNKPLPYTGNTK